MTTCVTGTCVGMIVLESFVHVSKGQNLPFGLSIGRSWSAPLALYYRLKEPRGWLYTLEPHTIMIHNVYLDFNKSSCGPQFSPVTCNDRLARWTYRDVHF